MNATVRNLALPLLVASACLSALAEPVDLRQRVEERTRAAPDLDARFNSSNGWIGADGIYSVALPGSRTAWLFSDTWTGILQDGKRAPARMINNSVGVTKGSGPAHFYYPNGSGRSPNIVARTAEHPWGPWSDKTLVYTCPEASTQRGVFCYAAKHQPAFSDDRTLAISYAANAHDMSTVLNDASLYVPRFIRVPIIDILK